MKYEAAPLQKVGWSAELSLRNAPIFWYEQLQRTLIKVFNCLLKLKYKNAYAIFHFIHPKDLFSYKRTYLKENAVYYFIQ